MNSREPGAHVVVYGSSGQASFVQGVPTEDLVAYHGICSEEECRVILFSKKTKIIEMEWDDLANLSDEER